MEPVKISSILGFQIGVPLILILFLALLCPAQVGRHHYHLLHNYLPTKSVLLRKLMIYNLNLDF
jgi:hypothetical protein